MASYNELNALIDAYINRNGVQAITGQILNGVLKAMVEQLGRGYTIMGAAIPTTDPGTPDGPECYFASETGTYTDFDGLQVAPGELALLCYTPTDGWTKETIYEGFQEVGASIDGNVGTPSVGVSYANGVLSFDFHNMKGNPGQNGQDGDAAGFGTIGADITGGVGTPGVTVESSGPATAKNLQFHFTNLKGETGVTSVVATVDNTTGTPTCTVSLVGQQLTLAFSGLKGAQGNTGSSVDYPFTIVNNLTTDDATQALSAAQGVVLDGKISQLQQEFDEKWTIGEDVQLTGFINGAYSTNGNYSTNILNKAGAKGKNLEVQPGQVYKIYGTSDASTWYRCCAVFKADGTKILTAPAGNFTTTPYEVTIPSDGAKMTINLINYNAETDGAFLVQKEEIDAATLDTKIEESKASAESAFRQGNFERGIRLKADRYSSIMTDWMQIVQRVSGMSSTAALPVVSSTETTITLSSEDAAYFTNDYNPCVVRWDDGTTKLVYFDKASGTSVPRMYFDTTDLTGASLVQSLHDTVRGGNGIHLSPLGYIHLGRWMAEDIERKITQKDKNLLAGVQFYTATESSDKKKIISAEGVEVASVDSDMPTSGVTPGGHLNAVGIVSGGENSSLGGFVNTAFRFVQDKGRYITFSLPVHGEGWLEVQAGQTLWYDTSTGNVTMEIYVDGVLFDAVNLVKFNRKYLFEGISAKKNISVKFITDVYDCECTIVSINFFAMSGIVPAVSLEGKKVAFLGDSWTQFPPASTALPEYADYNSPTIRPDGTEGGYGYLPKAFADASGAIVDNWGKSNMTSENWGLVMIDTVLAHAQYDYLVIEFFINDQNLGISYDDWARNIALIAEKCKKANVRPIIVCPCLQNGPTINPFGVRHEMIMRGLGTF